LFVFILLSKVHYVVHTK